MSYSIIMVASEASPFSKTGGLADVAGALPLALKRLGCRVTLFLPFYRETASRGIAVEQTGLRVTVPLGVREVEAEVLKAVDAEVPTYFIKRDELFDRGSLYGTPEGDYFDNLERFAFFSRAVLETLRERRFEPDIIHCNDWQTSLIPAYLRDVYKNDLCFARTATVLTIHNIAYQGIFAPELYPLTGLSPALFNPEGCEFWGRLNLLKAGIVYSDCLSTVSSAYSREIQTPEYGYGLEGVIQKRKAVLHGILNGVDYNEWDPSSDRLIPANYSEDDLSGKDTCRKALLKEFGLKLKKGTPVVGMVSRLADQKGFDILIEAIDEIMALDMVLVILGTGDKVYQEALKVLSAKYPQKLSVKIAFDARLSHLVEAGSDIFLMPSRYEPCGLNQIYSLRYATVPLVRATGGLDDTVRDFSGQDANGFKFEEYAADGLVAKLKEALSVYKDRPKWLALMKRGMAEDFSWEAAAGGYIELYAEARKACLKNNQPKR